MVKLNIKQVSNCRYTSEKDVTRCIAIRVLLESANLDNHTKVISSITPL
ncbi:MAG: hypothetical protein ACOYNC_18600 [Bacteroidales bacterium]